MDLSALSSVPLPAGHVVRARTVLRPVADLLGGSWVDQEVPQTPVCWLSDEPASPGLWSSIQSLHGRSGLWPLLVFDEVGDSAFGDFGEDEASLAQIDPTELFPQWWEGFYSDFFAKEDLRALGGRSWPGLARAGVSPASSADPSSVASSAAESLLAREPASLALVPAPRSADTLALAGWTPTDDETHFAGALSAVLRTWEDRFAARVVAVGRGTLWVSVAAPPTTREHAIALAAEHYAFCPYVEPREDFEYDSTRPQFLQYAESIVDQKLWRFWWD